MPERRTQSSTVHVLGTAGAPVVADAMVPATARTQREYSGGPHFQRRVVSGLAKRRHRFRERLCTRNVNGGATNRTTSSSSSP